MSGEGGYTEMLVCRASMNGSCCTTSGLTLIICNK